ncbi:MAG TPA: hypothetical protein VL463_03070 [Kofleriaceae bacterium]|nr:hypothetical protein [Kofleriaceae bacterium]
MIASRRLRPRGEAPRHALPAHDETIARLTDGERAIAAQVWHGRAEAEARASGAFLHVAAILERAGAAPELVVLAWRAVDDERRHAQICAQVARACGSTAPVLRLPVSIPRHDGADAELRRVLHVIGMCALNETCGSAFLELCRDGATAPLAAAALRELLADEIDHARLGWAFLAAQDRSTKATIGAWLPRLLDGNLRAWRHRPRRAITPALVAQGCPDWDEVDRAILAAIEDLLLPGFDHAGLDTRAARAWLAEAA